MPSPVKRKQIIPMDFPMAIYKIKEGSKVTKIEWANPNTYIYLKDGFLALRKADGKDYQLIVSEGDIVGEDWIVVSEKN